MGQNCLSKGFADVHIAGARLDADPANEVCDCGDVVGHCHLMQQAGEDGRFRAHKRLGCQPVAH